MGKLKVANSQDLLEGDPVSVAVEGELVMLVRFEGRPHAIGDVCTHEFALLSDGWFENGCIECPLHQALFDVRTGAVQCGPATRDARRFAASEKDGAVYLDFSPVHQGAQG